MHFDALHPMKTNTAAIWGTVVVIIVIIVIGAAIYMTRNPTSPQTIILQNPTTGTTPTTPPPIQTAGAPAVTTSTTVTPSNTAAIVAGSVVPNGAFTNYWYEYGLTSNLGSKTAPQSVGSGYVAIGAPYYITGLAQNTTYYYRLNAENALGTSVGTTYTFVTTTGSPSPVGGIPTIQTLAANNVMRTTASLNGQVTSNKDATTYWFEYGKTSDLGNVTSLVGVSATAVKSPASMQIIGLDPLATYCFRLDAQNEFGTVNGSILTFKTAGPAAAVAPSATTDSATSIHSTSATLRGTVNPNGADTTYSFEYSTDSGFSSALQTSDTAVVKAGDTSVSVSATVTNLSTTTIYYFRTVAQNTFGIVRGGGVSFKTK